ncbi:MAG: Na/Pi symporter [Rhodospirillaceae bacterium]
MDLFQTLGGLAGGLGLFMLAMKLMTDGLKRASGDTLKDILARWTATPVRGLCSGIMITALVQSSSAVTVATIGFVNAGLMTLFQAIGVVYGTNIGTTMTAWLVAALGFKIKVEIFALPMIGLGIGLWFLKQNSRFGAFGQALGGFGLFFVGIDILREAFESLSPMIDLHVVSQYGAAGVALMVGVGFLVTVLTQSSSAAIAITLTAATGGIIALPSAAAMVIGANVGTTSTALFAALNATPNAKRVATAHVIFNAVTGCVALLILPVLLFLIAKTGSVLNLEESPAITLALFHTVFNILGVALMWPLLRPLSSWLANRFKTVDEIEGAPKFIDKMIAETPALAFNALLLEVNRIGALSRRLGSKAISQDNDRDQVIHTTKSAIEALTLASGEFAADIQNAVLTPKQSETLPQLLRLSHYYDEAAEIASGLHSIPGLTLTLRDPELREDLEHFLSAVTAWFEAPRPGESEFILDVFEEGFETLEATYHHLKDRLLRAGIDQHIAIRDLGPLVEQLSTLNRVLKRILKAGKLNHALAIELNLDGVQTPTTVEAPRNAA